MLLLERRVAELEKESEASGEQHTRLRQENLHLVHRANALEEQLKEQEVLADEQLQQETRRHKEALSKLERETGVEQENLQTRWALERRSECLYDIFGGKVKSSKHNYLYRLTFFACATWFIKYNSVPLYKYHKKQSCH